MNTIGIRNIKAGAGGCIRTWCSPSQPQKEDAEPTQCVEDKDRIEMKTNR